MPFTALERRKFLRLDVNLESCIDNKIRGVIKTLSLGGCLIETGTAIHIRNPVCIKIFLEEGSFNLWGDVLCSSKGANYSIRFIHSTYNQNVLLINLIESLHKTSFPPRQMRLFLQVNAFLNLKPALMTNLSEGGGYIQTSASFKYDDIVKVEFKIKEEDIHLVGQVRRVEPRGIGIEFLSPDPTQINSISKYISLKTFSPQTFS